MKAIVQHTHPYSSPEVWWRWLACVPVHICRFCLSQVSSVSSSISSSSHTSKASLYDVLASISRSLISLSFQKLVALSSMVCHLRSGSLSPTLHMVCGQMMCFVVSVQCFLYPSPPSSPSEFPFPPRSAPTFSLGMYYDAYDNLSLSRRLSFLLVLKRNSSPLLPSSYCIIYPSPTLSFLQWVGRSIYSTCSYVCLMQTP